MSVEQTSGLGRVVEPRGGWPLRPPEPEPAASVPAPPSPEPELVAASEPLEPVDDLPALPLMDDLAALVASLNTSTEQVYVDRRLSAA